MASSLERLVQALKTSSPTQAQLAVTTIMDLLVDQCSSAQESAAELRQARSDCFDARSKLKAAEQARRKAEKLCEDAREEYQAQIEENDTLETNLAEARKQIFETEFKKRQEINDVKQAGEGELKKVSETAQKQMREMEETLERTKKSLKVLRTEDRAKRDKHEESGRRTDEWILRVKTYLIEGGKMSDPDQELSDEELWSLFLNSS